MARDVPWTFVSFGLTKAIALLTTVALAHLLDPSDFGLMALATLAFGALGLFQDLGLGATLVLRQDFEEKALETVLTLLIITSVAVMVIVLALTPVASSLLDQPRLNTILPVLSTTALFSTLAAFYDSMMQREMDFKRRFVGQTSQALSLALISIPLAIAGLGVWALVLGQVASMIVYSAVYLAIAPHRIRPGFDRGIAREAFVSGRGFLAQGWLAWINENIDYLLVGKLLGEAQLGFYSMAYRLSELTHFGIADPVAKVTFPAFARMRAKGEDIATSYLSALRLVALLACAVGGILSGAAAPFTLGIFGSNWAQMVAPLAVLGIWAALVPIQATIGWLLNSTGHAGSVGTLTAVILVPEIPLLIIAAHSSTAAVSWVILAQAAVSIPVLAHVVHRKLHIHIVPHIRALAPIALATGAAWLVSRLTANATDEIAPLVSLFFSVLLGVAAYSAIMAALDRDTLRLAARTANRMVRRDIATAA